MNRNTRIELTDSAMSAVIKLSEGNPGAAIACMDLMTKGPQIDPDGAMGGFGPLLSLDTHGIYGTDIYILHSDICGKDPIKTIGVLRAVQLGFFEESILKDAAHRQDRSGRALVPVDELLVKVKKQLPNFAKETI